MRTLARFAAVAVMLLGLAAVVATAPVSAAAVGTLVIHARQCPDSTPSDFFTDCHPFQPSVAVSFRTDGGSTKTVSSRSGNVKFRNLIVGEKMVTQVDGPPGDFTGRRVFCSIRGSGEPAVEVAQDFPNFTAPIEFNKTTVCDYYITIDAS